MDIQPFCERSDDSMQAAGVAAGVVETAKICSKTIHN